MKPDRQLWQNACMEVLAIMMQEQALFDMAVDELQIKPLHFPFGQARNTFIAISDIWGDGDQPSPNAVVDRSMNTPQQYIDEVLLMTSKLAKRSFESNVKIVIKHGQVFDVLDSLDFAKQTLSDGKSTPQQVMQMLNTDIDKFSSGTANQHKMLSASEHGKVYRELALMESNKGRATGIDYLDGISEGWLPNEGRLWMVAGAFKGRKTSLVLNMILSACMQGLPVAFMSKEMTSRAVYSKMIVMLYTIRIYTLGLYNDRYEYTSPSGVSTNPKYTDIDTKRLTQLGKRQFEINDTITESLEWAYDVYESLPLVIFDSSRDGGNLSDPESLITASRNAIRYHDSQIIMADYLQLFRTAGASLFEDVSATSMMVQDFVRDTDKSFVMIAQKNEDGVRESQESYSPKVKGGGDPSQACDYMVTTRYSEDQMGAGFMQLHMKLSRWGESGQNAEKVNVPIHAKSGLIIDQKWLNKIPK